MSADKEHFAPIEEIKPGEAVDLVNRVAAALRLTPGRPQDLGAWERLARKLAERFDGRGDFIGARIAYIESRASQGLPPATRDELAAFADGFAASTPRTAELDRLREQLKNAEEQLIAMQWDYQRGKEDALAAIQSAERERIIPASDCLFGKCPRCGEEFSVVAPTGTQR